MQNDSKLKRFLAAIALTLVALFAAKVATAAEIPAGTAVPVRIDSSLSSGSATAGQTFTGSVARDVVVNGNTLVKAGTPVKGRVTSAKSSGRLHAPGYLSLRLTSVGDQNVTSTAVGRRGKSHTKSNVTKIGGTTAAGAVIGALAGGGKGAAIGAGAGAAAGTGLAAATGKQEAIIPAESVLTFTVNSGSASSARRGR